VNGRFGATNCIHAATNDKAQRGRAAFVAGLRL